MCGRFGTIMSFLGQHQQQQVRGMATLKTIAMRLKSVKNIKKITQSMKMVSAAKYARAERELKKARPYGEGARVFYEKVEVAPVGESPRRLLIAMTSDKGLSGAVHAQVTRSIKNELAENPGNTKIICVGDKSRAILQRSYAKNIILVVNEVGKKPPTFLEASKLATYILKSEYVFQAGKIVYNRFQTVVSYETSALPIYNLDALSAAHKLPVYDSLDDEILLSYLEFSLASLLYYSMKEGAVSEQSARMTAMDNASKNAAEMITDLGLRYNRTRQAVVTQELIEIISGASALR
ncbi:ATP synthase subunit gamma, mitochondrial-like [Anabrus simplex]|uniref:ATP synthase subunit gamma, mitochondrial-like n=1 Tax=Anabrus simplex TaxID=316456 RepID=UPI0034DD67CA